MKKFYLLTVLIILGCFSIRAQVIEKEKELKEVTIDTIFGWKKGGVVIINMSQTSLTNWAAGGQSAVSGNSLVNLYMNHKKTNSAWDNSLNLGLGMQYQIADEKLIKTDDKIDFTSKYGQKAANNLYYALLVNFKTQFAVGYNYPNDSVSISDFMAPAYLITALGMDYKPGTKLSIFAAPVTGRFTFVQNEKLANQGSFGVEKAVYDTSGNILQKGETSKTEFGGYIRILYKNDNILKNVGFYTRLELFSNYLNNPGNIDVNWESILAIKLAKYFSAVLTLSVVYDDDVLIATDNKTTGNTDMVGPRTQIKEVFGFGFSYKFSK
jgi:hypothetical protein